MLSLAKRERRLFTKATAQLISGYRQVAVRQVHIGQNCKEDGLGMVKKIGLWRIYWFGGTFLSSIDNWLSPGKDFSKWSEHESSKKYGNSVDTDKWGTCGRSTIKERTKKLKEVGKVEEICCPRQKTHQKFTFSKRSQRTDYLRKLHKVHWWEAQESLTSLAVAPLCSPELDIRHEMTEPASLRAMGGTEP